MAASEQDMPFIRNLASSDRRIREKAVSSLETFLSAQHNIDRLMALKLWKGLFYAMWMCDKPLPQQRLCDEIAGLYTSLPGAMPSSAKSTKVDVVPIWFLAAWEVIATQWTEIDVLRMEKFLLLVRRLLAAHLRWVEQHNWAKEKRDKIIAVLQQWPFESEGDMAKVPLGLRLHIMDIWVDEMEKVGMLEEQADESAVNEAALFAVEIKEKLVEPLTSCPVKAVRNSSRDELEDERLPWNKGKSAQDEAAREGMGSEQDDDEWDGFGD
ncbi:ribosomal RNA-processing protein [Plectosphaerella cucumerina]|uniref:Ribosomal RNA-processing protein n=1 Tax=Plectosphaerella cucumerina TaxID=40658 RepID=A0A8K0X0K9_9PEZI|nr:ribosomal RNA-processing protein [Plectosphaerella cucumerina]